jgi:Putative addiction module component
MDLRSLEAELLKLSSKEKAEITYKLLESLESDESDNIDEVWINEALARYYQLSGKDVVDSETVIKEAKLKYK